MSRAIFHSNNRVGQEILIKTNITSGSTFDPGVTLVSGLDRVSWDLGNGIIKATNSFSYTFAGDTGTTKTIKLKTNRFSKIYELQIASDEVVGNLDLSYFSNLGGRFTVVGNTNLTGLTHTYSTRDFTIYYAWVCNLTGTLDVSKLYGLGNEFWVQQNPNLTNIINPPSTKVYTKYYAYDCSLDYVDFNPLSGATFKNSVIYLQNNTMSAGDVNHILYDFKNITIANPTTWSGVTLAIGGNNQNPDSSSGGYDGLSYISTLIGSPYSWSITY